MKPDTKDYIHSYKVLKQAKFIYGDREQNSGCFWQWESMEGNGEIDWKLSGMMDMFNVLMGG